MKRVSRLLAAAMLFPLSAFAQSDGPPNPFLYTCGEFVAAETNEQRYVANLMTYWMVGYMHGRFGEEPGLTLDEAHHDGSVADMVSALQRLCPNVPTMTFATFAQNLAGDLQKSLQ